MKRKTPPYPYNSYTPGVPNATDQAIAGDFPGSSGSPSLLNFSKGSAQSPILRRHQNLSNEELLQLDRELEGIRDGTKGGFSGLAEVWTANEAERQAGLLIDQASEELQWVKIELIARGMVQKTGVQSEAGQDLSRKKGSDEAFATDQQQIQTDYTAREGINRTEAANLHGNSSQEYSLAEPKTEPLGTKVKSYRGTLANRRQHRPDARKELIAGLKAHHPNALARKICELIDRRIASTPVLRDALAPLESWQRQAPSKRSWLEFFTDAKTHNLVRSYVNKVPPLTTAAKFQK